MIGRKEVKIENIFGSKSLPEIELHTFFSNQSKPSSPSAPPIVEPENKFKPVLSVKNIIEIITSRIEKKQADHQHNLYLNSELLTIYDGGALEKAGILLEHVELTREEEMEKARLIVKHNKLKKTSEEINKILTILKNFQKDVIPSNDDKNTLKQYLKTHFPKLYNKHHAILSPYLQPILRKPFRREPLHFHPGALPRSLRC